MCQSIPLRSRGFPTESVTKNRILETEYEFIIEKLRNLGSYWKGKLLVKLSVGKAVRVLLDTPSTKLSVIASQFMCNVSMLLVMLGSLLPNSVCVVNFASKPSSSPKLLFRKSS